MEVRIVTLEAEHLPALARFSERTWERPRTPDFYRWRYVEAPFHRAFMALRGHDCVAVLSVFSRPYRLGGRPVTCLEAADWYCLPELRLSGLGIRLMRRVMAEPSPIVAVGGSADTLKLLPRMGWQQIGQAGEFVLELGSSLSRPAWALRSLMARLAQRRSADSRAIRDRLARPVGAHAETVAGVVEDVVGLYEGPSDCASVPLPRPNWLGWLARGQSGRRLVSVLFRLGRDSKLAGWSLLRLDAGSQREALLLDLFAPAGEPDLYGWMVAESVAVAAAAGSTRIRTGTSCPNLQTALRDNRFVERHRWPVHFWSAGYPIPPAPRHFGLNNGDAALLPYPTNALVAKHGP